MKISSILLATFLILFALMSFEWVAVEFWVMGLFALSAGIALVIEALTGRN